MAVTVTPEQKPSRLTDVSASVESGALRVPAGRTANVQRDRVHARLVGGTVILSHFNDNTLPAAETFRLMGDT